MSLRRMSGSLSRIASSAAPNAARFLASYALYIYSIYKYTQLGKKKSYWGINESLYDYVNTHTFKEFVNDLDIFMLDDIVFFK